MAEILTKEFDLLLLKASKDIVPEGSVLIRSLRVKSCGCCGVVDIEVAPRIGAQHIRLHLDLQEFGREFFDGVAMDQIEEDAKEIVDSIVEGFK